MSRHQFSEVVANCDSILEQCDNESDAITEKLGEDEDMPDSTEPKDIGSVRECCGQAHVVSLMGRKLCVMAHVRRHMQEPTMRTPNLKQIVAVLRQMTPSQLKAVATEVAALDTCSGATAVIEGRFAAEASCPHCRSERAHRHGQANGLQRYRCRECRRTFNALHRRRTGVRSI